MKLLMVDPEYFSIKYAINPFMKSPHKGLCEIDKASASLQWRQLKSTFESLKVEVEVISPHEKYPDMVFCANHGLIYNKSVVLSKMRYHQRQGEPKLYKSWYKKNGFEVIDSETFGEDYFEGTGDAIWSKDGRTLFAGYGFRTTLGAYEKIKSIIGNKDIIPLKLVDETFYHLDTCFTILDRNTVAVVESAFDSEGLTKINNYFKKVISIERHEAIQFLAANAFSVDGKNIVLQKGAAHYVSSLKKEGYNAIEVETGEFIKAGGSVFCMKMILESSP